MGGSTREVGEQRLMPPRSPFPGGTGASEERILLSWLDECLIILYYVSYDDYRKTLDVLYIIDAVR